MDLYNEDSEETASSRPRKKVRWGEGASNAQSEGEEEEESSSGVSEKVSIYTMFMC